MSPIYEFLEKIKNGYDPDWRYYNDADKLIDNVRFNPNNPGKSIISIVFDDSNDFYDLFELDDDDKWWANALFHRQVNDEWSNYEIEDDWRQGYIYESLDEENRSNLDRAGFTASKKNPNMDMKDKLELLYDNFGEVSEIVSAYKYIETDCRNEKSREEIIDELGNKFYTLGIREVSVFYKYVTNVNILLRLFKTIGNEDMSLKELLKTIIEKFHGKMNYGSYSEMYYESWCGNFDNDSFNREAKWYIDRIVSNIEDSEGYLNVEEYFYLVDEIKDNYGFDKWIPFKTKPNLFYKIENVNPETNKIIVIVRNNESDDREESRSMTFDELQRLDTQYELFNERRKIIKKFLRMI
jgi:hypothetical protein